MRWMSKSPAPPVGERKKKVRTVENTTPTGMLRGGGGINFRMACLLSLLREKKV